ncbi:MAG TPA: helix-turn-helix transcriptional regulator, partial [Pontiella sp.]|nr:helix-turn-helix transcriptional regulator [Pontiella sp.]
TIGQKLEAARQAKGVTVSEAGQATKILSKFIEAMEADDFGALSAPVYAKSFIKMYAQYLGLDPRPLVDEYVDQHAPRAKPSLGDEVRQNLAQNDAVSVGADGTATVSPARVGSRIFSDVNEAIARLSKTELPWKIILPSAGGVLLLVIVLLSATQCSEDKDVEPAPAGGAASVQQREVITEGAPDVFLGKPGQLKVDRY